VPVQAAPVVVSGTGPAPDWQLRDPATDNIPGTGAARALRDLLTNAAPKRRVMVAVIDGDGSLDPADLTRLADLVESGVATMAVGRRRPIGPGLWPWHARAGNAVICWRLRRTAHLPVHDIAPIRVSRRDDLLALEVVDRRFGYPLELLLKAGAAGWRVVEIDVAYGPRAVGTRSKVSGSVSGTLRAMRDFARVLR